MESRQPLLIAYAFSAVAAVTAVLGSLVFMETATVKLTVPTSKLTAADVIISGGKAGHDLATTRIQAEVTDSQQSTTSTMVIPATSATGQVVFTCNPCQSGTQPIPDGTPVSTAGGIHYATQGRADIVPPHTSVEAPIRAMLPGKAGNTAAKTVTVIDKVMPNFTVQNPQPITGGVDASTVQVVQQSDLDRVRAELTAQVTQDLNAALQAQAGGLSFVTEAQPALKVTADHVVGDKVPTLSMTITATQAAVAFSDSQAGAILRAALNQKLPKGFQMATDSIQTSYQIQGSGANVTVKGTATGVVVPSVTAGELKARIKGMRVEAARQQLKLVAPGTAVDISVKPAVPWLPVIQDHIQLTIVLQHATG